MVQCLDRRGMYNAWGCEVPQYNTLDCTTAIIGQQCNSTKQPKGGGCHINSNSSELGACFFILCVHLYVSLQKPVLGTSAQSHAGVQILPLAGLKPGGTNPLVAPVWEEVPQRVPWLWQKMHHYGVTFMCGKVEDI